MKSHIAASLFAAAASFVHALPAPVPQAASVMPAGPPGSSGSLRGTPALLGYDPANPLSTDTTVIPTSEFELAPGQSANANLGLFLDLSEVENPQPIRGDTQGPTDPGPRTYAYDRLNSDIFAPPGTDASTIPNAKWPFGLSHNRHGLANSGWARNQNSDNIPAATAMAGVDMRLSPHAYRELHWHKANEWALMLKGSVRIAAVNEQGQSVVDDVQAGDVWFFPSGVPHSIQAFENGAEFLLVFDDGSFSEDGTFLASELFERNPRSVLAKNFRTDVSAFNNLPTGQLWIFNGTPAPTNISAQNITGPAGAIPAEFAYTYHFSQQQPYMTPGGSVKIIDPETFPIASNFAAALITIEPGAMRELHWHINSDEWAYLIQGDVRITLYSAPAMSRTFDFTAGDVAYIPYPDAHYIENTGNETAIYLEVLQAPKFNDISVGQWLALTPPQVVKDTLNLSDSVIASLPKVKPLLLPGNPNLLTTNFTGEAL